MIRETLMCAEGLQVKSVQRACVAQDMSSYIQYSTTWLGTQVQDNTQNYPNKNNNGSAHIFFKLNLRTLRGLGLGE